ncbi:MAG: molybdenum ABC transporter permease subunit [Porticoccaceae bacterium]|nr:MAG: molybdenum ABC transporter permease subunit [Porticoccaceae bacterium]
MSLGPAEWQALLLTARLAAATTAVLLLLAPPLAWWLAVTPSRWRGPVAALVALPLVLPPTVLGFYLLLALGPSGPLGALTQALGLGTLPFTFTGLVVASVLYSLPFAVQPLEAAMAQVGRRSLEVAATLRTGPLAAFFWVVLPQVRRALVAAGVLSFAHTAGEFGVVLMIGGNIPGETRVASVLLYDLVEALEYERAHALALALVLFSFACLTYVYSRREAWGIGVAALERR